MKISSALNIPEKLIFLLFPCCLMLAGMSQAEAICTDESQSQVQVTPGAPGNFITTWKTNNSGTSGNQQITIPTSGTGYNYEVYWINVNDASQNGTVSAMTGPTTISFPEAGTYRVEISGAFPRIVFNNGGDRLKIQSVEQWGTTKWTSMENAFRGAANLQINARDAPDLSIAKNMGGMFQGATNMNSPIGHWDVSNIEIMYDVFKEALVFNQDLNDWKTLKMRETYGMFQNATSFNQDLNKWNVSNVTAMYNMFTSASSFNGNISTWDVSKVTNMSSMFYGASSFNGKISNWDVANVTNMYAMFQNAKAFNQDLNTWNVAKVTNMSSMFYGASSFYGNISNWNVGNVTEMTGMFQEATAFNQDLNKWNVAKVTKMSSMFRDARSFNGNISNWAVDNVTDMNAMFQNVTAFNQDLSTWNVAKVTNMYAMFYAASSFNGKISNWDVGNVKDMGDMFQNATAFNQDLSNWNVSKVRYMQGMLSSSGLSIQNYDSTLIGWAARGDLQRGVLLGAVNLAYCEGADARQQLINQNNWSIGGDKKDGSCGITPSDDRIVYVNLNVTAGNGSGDSWTNAVKELADALKWARLKWGPAAGWDAANPLKIYVANGLYKPKYTAGQGVFISSDSRENSFVMVPSTQLYGGFDPANGITNLTHPRILPALGPGDSDSGYGTVLDGRVGNKDVYHVVITAGNEIDNSFLMDGFTIKNGFGDENISILVHGKRVHHRWGAGWYNAEGSPRINSVLITNMFVTEGEGDGLGAGMYNADGNPKMSNMVIRGNGASHKGGGIYNGPPSPILNRVIDNAALYEPSLTNVIISGNSAPEGAGIYNLASNPVLTNVTISGNSSAGMVNDNSFPIIRNSIFWGNQAGILDAGQGQSTVSYSIIQGDYEGVNVMNTDPLFVDMPGHATAPFVTGNYTFTTNSPAFNTGDPRTNTTGYAVQAGAADLAGNLRTQNGRIELGAYEVTCSLLTLAVDGTSVTRLLSNVQNYFFDACSLVARVEPKGDAAPVSGEMTAKTWTKTGIVSFGNARYLRRYYDLAPVANKENATADITLYYSQEDFNAYNSEYGTSNNAQLPTDPIENIRGNIRIAQFRGGYTLNGLEVEHLGQPTYIVPKSVMWNKTNRFWEVTFSVTGFSGFFLTGQSDAGLPVTLIGFSAKKQEHDIQLTWQTSSETNSDRFEVQRSRDSRHFETIGTVSAAGESTKTAIYHYSDKVVESNTELYYRLKMVDHDGSYAHSRIVSISGEGNANKRVVNLYPNPSNGRIMIETTGMEQPEIVVYDLSGRKTPFTSQPVSMRKTQLTFSTPQSGIYTVVIKQGNYVTVKIIAVD